MTQEVKILLQLTLDVNAQLSRTEIAEKVNSAIHFSKDDGIDNIITDIIEIQEESEIYGTEE